MKSPLNSASAKTEMAKAMKAGSTKAKSANVPAKTQKSQEKMAVKAVAANAKWEQPSLYALCRKLAGNDIAAGIWLFHVLYVWRNRKVKLERGGKNWLAHSREAWAIAAGLSNAEFTKRALPRVRKHCADFIEARAMERGAKKRLWVHVNELALQEAVYGTGAFPWDMFHAALNGLGPGNEKPPANAYSKGK